MSDAKHVVQETVSLTERNIDLTERVVDLEDALRQGQKLIAEAQQRAQAIADRCRVLQVEAAAGRKLHQAVVDYVNSHTARLGELKQAHAMHELRVAAEAELEFTGEGRVEVSLDHVHDWAFSLMDDQHVCTICHERYDARRPTRR